MSSVLKNVEVEEVEKKTYAKKDYLAAKKDFPINITREFRIIDGSPARQLYLGKNSGCRSWDGEVGKTVESGYKDERDCDECKYKFGFADEHGEKIQCKSQYMLIFEHEDPEKQYALNIPYGAQKNLNTYVKKLSVEGLDVDQVMTGITRVENTESAGTTYMFKKIRELELEMTSEEAKALENLKLKAISGNPIPASFAVQILLNLESLSGITKERATRLAESIAVDGKITGESN